MLKEVIKVAGKIALGIAGLYVCDKAAGVYTREVIDGVKELHQEIKKNKKKEEVTTK